LLACSSDGGLEDDRGPTGPQSHLLQPINEDIVYSYREADSAVTQPTLLEIGYGSLDYPCRNKEYCSQSKSTYPLVLTLDIPADSDDKVEIKEFMFANGKELKLFGYSLYNLPLSLLGVDTDKRVGMAIVPNLGAAIYHTDMHLADYAEVLDFGETTIMLYDITNDEIAEFFLALDMFDVFGVPPELFKLAVEFVNVAQVGIPVNLSGTTAYSKALDVSDTDWVGYHSCSNEYDQQAHQVDYTLVVSVSIADVVRKSLEGNFFASLASFLKPLPPLEVKVDASIQFVPGLGPIMRRFTVTNSIDKDAPVFTTEIVLQKVLDGDSDKDCWVDALDRFPDDETRH
jgi:hypothetical protein